MATVHLPRPHGGREFLEQVREGFWVLTLGVLVCFAFFAALGAFDPTDSAAVSIGAGVLAALWLGHAWMAGRSGADRDPRLTHDRERRGF